MFQWLTKKRRAKIKSEPTPFQWIEVLKKEMPLYNSLSSKDKKELESHLKILFSEKQFIGAHGLVVTEEMKVLICAQAALLMLHREPTYFPNVNTIIIYESTFASMINEGIGSDIYIEKYQPRVGESSHRTKTVVLAWDSVLGGSLIPNDGRNVVLHEFAHQLDSENGSANGAPALSSNSAYRLWSREMTKEFSHLQENVARHHKTFLDKYGATSPGEFFAVMTEAFFEKPQVFKRKLPQIYSLLEDFYHLDPATAFSESTKHN